MCRRRRRMTTPAAVKPAGAATGARFRRRRTTGSTVTANEKQFIIHLQDIKTANSAPFANKKYHIQSGDNSFDVTSNENGDILLDISPKEHPRPNTVIGDTPTTITEVEVPDGYQVIPSSTKIYINVVNDGDDYHLNSIQNNGNNNPFAIDMAKRQLTLMRFPVAKLKLRVTDSNNNALSGAILRSRMAQILLLHSLVMIKENVPFLSNCMREIISEILFT